MTVYEGTLDRAQILAGFIEASRLGLRLGEEFVADADNLNVDMDFDRVIYSDGRGHVADVVGLWAPEAHQYEDEHGSWETDFMAGENGWRLMDGYSGQQGYAGPWMHQSEFIGGSMATDILATAGFYVAICPSVSAYNDEGTDSADSDYDQNADIWAVAHISENIPGSI